MATLNAQDFSYYADAIRADSAAKAELRTWHPPKQTLWAVMQAIEDAMTTGLIPQAAVGVTMPVYLRGVMNAAAGTTVTVTMAKKLFKVWMDRKFRSE